MTLKKLGNVPQSSASASSFPIEITELLEHLLLAKKVWSSWQQIPPQQRCSCTEGDNRMGWRQTKHNVWNFSLGKMIDTQITVLGESCVWLYLVLNVLQRLYVNVAYLRIQILGKKSQRHKNKKWKHDEFFNVQLNESAAGRI